MVLYPAVRGSPSSPPAPPAAGPVELSSRVHDRSCGVERIAGKPARAAAAHLAEGQVAELVHNDQIDIAQRQRNRPGFAGGLLPLKRIDQIHRRVKAHPPSVAGNAGDAQGRGQVRLAGAGATDEDDIVSFIGKRQLGQRCDPRAFDARLREVEAGQIRMNRESIRARRGRRRRVRSATLPAVVLLGRGG